MKRAGLFISMAAVVSIAFGAIYTTSQQVLRQGANDPQIQIAEDGAKAWDDGKKPGELFGKGQVDLSRSLAPVEIVYGNDGKVLASTARLNGQTPALPSGVLTSANSRDRRLTWQPNRQVRLAAVVVKANGGYVLAARSMREVEKRIDELSYNVLIAWIAAIIFLGAAYLSDWLRL